MLPGNYQISATLQGFEPGKVPDVRVGLGDIKKVDFALALAGVTERVEVTAESPLVDVKQSGRFTNIRAEQVNLLPHNRDFTSLVTHASGANMEAKSAPAGQPGLMLDGAAAAENRYVIDGIETTNMSAVCRARISSRISSRKCRSSPPATPLSTAARPAA